MTLIGDADEILDLNAVAWFDVARDRFRPHPCDMNLAVRIFDVGEEHIPRHLAVNAQRLIRLRIPSRVPLSMS